jgi:hypothetical protein
MVTNNSPVAVTNIQIGIGGTNAADFSAPYSSTCGIPPFTLLASTSCTFQVVFKPSLVGPELATLNISSSLPTLNVALSGTGYSAISQVNCAPSTLIFGSTNENQASQPQQVTCLNPGSVPVVFSGITFASGVNFSQTNNCGTLAQNASCAINVTFDPTALGTLTDTMSINDNAANSPQTVAVSGVGQTPSTPTPSSIAVTPAAATIQTGATEQYNVVLTMSDSSTQNITGQSFYNSTNPGVASIGPLASLANGIAAGTTTIAALPEKRQVTQGSSNTSMSTLTTSAFQQNVVPGDTIICSIQTQEAAVTISSVVDTQGDTFIHVSGADENNSSIQQWIYYAQPVTGAGANVETVTVTFSGAAQSPSLSCADDAGLTGGVDVAAANGSNTGSAGVPLTTTNATDFIFSAVETQAGSGAAAALVQSTSCVTTNTTSLTCSLTGSTAGHYYAVGLTSNQSAQTWSSVIDTAGDICPAAAPPQQFSTNGESQWWICPLGTSGNEQIRANATGAISQQMVVAELSGLANTGVLDKQVSQNAPTSTASMTTGNVSTTVTDMGLGLFVDNNVSGNFTAGTGYTSFYGLTNYVTGAEYDLSVASGSRAIPMTDSVASATWIANGIFLKVSGSVSPLITGVGGGALNLTAFGTNSIILQTPAFATGTYTPSVTISPSGNAIVSSVAFKAVSGNTGLTVTSGSGQRYNLRSHPIPATFYPYPSGPSSIPGTGPLFNTPIPSVVRSALAGAATNPTYCFNNNCTYSVANAQYTMTNGNSCSEIGTPNTPNQGCFAYFILPVGSSGDSSPGIWPSQVGDPYYKFVGSDNVSVIAQCPNNAVFSGSTADQSLVCFDQTQQILVGLYTSGKGQGFALGNCPNGTLANPCSTTNGNGLIGAERVGIDPSYEASTNWSAGGYTFGGLYDNIGGSVLAYTTRLQELISGTIKHAIVFDVVCTNNIVSGFKGNFPGNGAIDLPCPTQNINMPVFGGLYTYDYTDAQLATICAAVAIWKCAAVTAITHYGSYPAVTGGGFGGYGPAFGSVGTPSEGLQAYYSLGVPFASSPVPALTALGGWIYTMSAYNGTTNDQGGVLLDSLFPKIVTSGSTSHDIEGNACGSGSGCYPSGHFILLNSCVARTMAQVAGGC